MQLQDDDFADKFQYEFNLFRQRRIRRHIANSTVIVLRTRS